MAAARRKARRKTITFSIEVPEPTPEQVEVLKKIFQVTTVAVLGLPTKGEVMRQSAVTKRRRR